MLEQAIHQLLARVVFRIDFLQLRIHRQQHLGLDVNQRRRHVDELRSQIDIQLARLFHVRKILRGDGGDGDVLDIDLLLANQVQQQIERPFVVLQMDV